MPMGWANRGLPSNGTEFQETQKLGACPSEKWGVVEKHQIRIQSLTPGQGGYWGVCPWSRLRSQVAVGSPARQGHHGVWGALNRGEVGATTQAGLPWQVCERGPIPGGEQAHWDDTWSASSAGSLRPHDPSPQLDTFHSPAHATPQSRAHCVTLGESLNLSEPLPCDMGMVGDPPQGHMGTW